MNYKFYIVLVLSKYVSYVIQHIKVCKINKHKTTNALNVSLRIKV